eukprot:6183936-Pleurochrysis_carterae.AAC.1
MGQRQRAFFGKQHVVGCAFSHEAIGPHRVDCRRRLACFPTADACAKATRFKDAMDGVRRPPQLLVQRSHYALMHNAR